MAKNIVCHGPARLVRGHNIGVLDVGGEQALAQHIQPVPHVAVVADNLHRNRAACSPRSSVSPAPPASHAGDWRLALCEPDDTFLVNAQTHGGCAAGRQVL